MIGPYVLGEVVDEELEAAQEDEAQDDGAETNRQRLLKLCKTHRLCIPQTFFPQKPRCNVTHRPPGVEHGPAWTADRYRQIDFIICKQ